MLHRVWILVIFVLCLGAYEKIVYEGTGRTIGKITVQAKTTTTTKKTTTTTKKKTTTTAKKKTTTAKKKTTTTTKKKTTTTAKKKTTTTAKKKTTTTAKKATTTQVKATTTTAKKATTIQAKATTTQAKATTTQAKATTTQAKATMTTAKKATTTQAKATTTQAKATTTQAKATTTQAKATTTQAKATTTQAKATTTQAKATTTQAKATTTQAKETTTEEKIITEDITPEEPESSDLKVIHSVTKLQGPRWIQSFTKDSKYYYFIQMTDAVQGHCRVTRVKYTGLGKYTSAKMDLKNFGHGTNLDCSVYNGKTYLWTGGDSKVGSKMSRSITAFEFKSNTVLNKHGSIVYEIPIGLNGNAAVNVYPAISEDQKYLTVRFTSNKKQYFQTYSLVNGTEINVKKLLDQSIIPATAGDFQGFDVSGKVIYTIEGSPRASFLKTFDASRVYMPTIVRTFNYLTKQTTSKEIKGASTLSFREPEGIDVAQDGTILMMYVSHLLTNQSCNIYQIK